jgi:flagellar motor switch protein FliG
VRKDFRELLAERVVVFDGATGTRLYDRGIFLNRCFDELNLSSPDLVEEIRRLMFVFEDITKLSDKDVQAVLKNVESAQWAMALKGASDELKEKILGNMSKRAAQMLEEEMEMGGMGEEEKQ